MESGDQSVADHQPVERRSVRANRACASCRVRKQRCILSSMTGQTACQRCAHHGMPCSFETEPADAHQEQPGPTKLAQMVVQLQQRVNQHEARIAELEHLDATPHKYPRLSSSSLPTTSLPITSDHESQSPVRIESHLTRVPQIFNTSIEQLELGAPIATLRALGALGDARDPANESTRMNTNRSCSDPIESGMLTETEASRAFNIYFEHCHPWAPVLSQKTRSMGISLRETSPTLFLAIVAIGARFWCEDNTSNDTMRLRSMHPHYFDVIKLLDSNMSRLLLRPCAASASLSNIQSLLLYLQWMPYDSCPLGPGHARSQTLVQTRYNEMSTWVVFGLALRYAEFCGLEQKVLGSFQDDRSLATATSEDMDAMRVWLNLVTYDCNLTLTSGMPSSLDPRPLSARAYRFCSHPAAQKPDDVRYASTVELACIIQNVRYQKDNITDRNQVLAVITEANGEFNNWQRRWFDRLGNTKLQQCQMPFTSVRWYRLALNSSLLRAVLSQTQPELLSLPSWATQPMTVSLTAASQIFLSVSKCSFESVSTLESWRPSTFPEGSLLLDPEARRSLHHAVDSTWISYTFAITFLVLCYLRGLVDDDLQLCTSSRGPSISATMWPAKPRHASLLHRLSRLALEVFGGSEQASNFRPDNDYTTVVQNATSLILEAPTDAEPTLVQPENISSLQTFFDLMEDPTWDWGMSFVGEQTEWGTQL
ncbi:hypothetical protein DPSP01_013555 [Paraphaeosphaeria sporulosa]